MEYHYYREQRPYWKNSFLLNDWLGKPAIPWSHHYIFRKGTSYFEEILHFINSTINPEWSNITRVLEKNYMVAMREGTMCVNLFSNMSRIDLGDYQGDVIISKFCDGLASNDSKLYINGDEIAWDVSSPFLLSLLYQPKQKRFLDVCIRPVTSEINASQGTFSIIARIRRLLVEARDQMTPFLQVGRFPPTYGPID